MSGSKVWVEMMEAVWREAQTPTFNDLPRLAARMQDAIGCSEDARFDECKTEG
jgi:hypothetical protein